VFVNSSGSSASFLAEFLGTTEDNFKFLMALLDNSAFGLSYDLSASADVTSDDTD